MRQLRMDSNVLACHRRWTSAVYPGVLKALACGAQYTVVMTQPKSYQYVYPASVAWAPGYFKVIAGCFGVRKNLTCAKPKTLYRCVKATDTYLGNLGLCVKSRNGDLSALHAYCKALFSYEEMCQGHVLVVDTKNPSLLRWQVPVPPGDAIDALRFIESLHIKVCPYCNQGSLNLNKKFPRSEIDHYFPRAYYPCLGISLYNLVPACTECNQKLKGKKIPNYATMYSPYDDPDYHDAVRLHDSKWATATELLPAETKVMAEVRSAKVGSRHLDFSHIVDYLSRYSDAYSQRAAALFNLYPVRLSSYRQESIRKIAKKDKPFARKYFDLLYSPRDINKVAFSKLAIDIVKMREQQIL